MHSGRLNFMMLAGADAIAAGAQLPAKAATLSPWKMVKSSLFEKDIYYMHFGSFGHLQPKM